MKLSILKENFLKALTYAYQVIGGKNATSEFENFLISCDKDGMIIKASDGVTSILTRTKIKDIELSENEKTFSFQTNAKVFYDCVLKMSENELTLETNNYKNIKLSDVKTKFNLSIQNSETYPKIDFNCEPINTIKMPLHKFKYLYNKTQNAVAIKTPKEVFLGVNISCSNSILSFLTTDSYRMAQSKVKLTDEYKDISFNIVSPIKPLNIVCKEEQVVDELELCFDETRALFITSNFIVNTRLYKGQFPPLDKILNKPLLKHITVSVKDFLATSERANILSLMDNKTYQVKLSIKGKEMSLISKANGYGEFNETISIDDNELDDFTIGVNINHIISAIKTLDSKTITFNFDTPTSLFSITTDDTENQDLQILTPIRLTD